MFGERERKKSSKRIRREKKERERRSRRKENTPPPSWTWWMMDLLFLSLPSGVKLKRGGTDEERPLRHYTKKRESE